MRDEANGMRGGDDRVAGEATGPPSPSHSAALDAATRRLAAVSESPRLDAELLLREVTGLDRVGLRVRHGEPLSPAQDERYGQLLARRLAGEPIAYILGRRGFRALELAVDDRVLIPRPETEWLVDAALDWLAGHPGPRRVIDVGTGSGAIALALATELPDRRPDVEIIATDISRPALRVAALNRERLGLRGRVALVASDLLAGLSGPFDLILANLPYLRPDQRHPSTRLEPPSALVGGPDGFDLHRALLRQSRAALTPDGLYLGEIDPAQSALAVAFATEATGRPARIAPDLAGDARYLIVGSPPARLSS